MEVKNIDVVSAELAKRVLDRVVKGLHIVTAVLGLLLKVLDELVVRGVLHVKEAHQHQIQLPNPEEAISDCTYLGSNNQLVTVAAELHPLANKLFGGLLLVVVGGVDEVAAGFVVGVKELEALLLVHGTHAEGFPAVTDAHSTELDGGDLDTGLGGEGAVLAKFGRGRGECFPQLRHG